MEIAVSTGLYYRKHYTEILDILAAAGCEKIELFLNQAFLDVPIEKIHQAVRDRQLQVSSIHLPLTFLAYDRDENEAYWIEKAMAYGEVLGTNLFVTHFFYDKEDKSRHNDEQHFENVVKYGQSGIVCTENFPAVGPGKTVGTVLTQIHGLKEKLVEKNMAMTFDVTHAASFEMGILEQYELFKAHIRNIHLSDYIDGRDHVVPGRGELPLKELLLQLQKDGYDHPITIELDFENPARNHIRDDQEAIQLISDSLTYVKEVLFSIKG